jgi:hypothetical protein
MNRNGTSARANVEVARMRAAVAAAMRRDIELPPERVGERLRKTMSPYLTGRV